MRCLRFSPWIAVLAVVIALIQPAKAEFFGALASDAQVVMGVRNFSNSRAAVTVYYVGRSVEVIDVITVPAGQTTSHTFPKPGRARRVIIEVDPPPGGITEISVNGAAPVLCESVRRGDTFRTVFDVQ